MDRDATGRFIAGNKYRWSSTHQPVKALKLLVSYETLSQIHQFIDREL